MFQRNFRRMSHGDSGQDPPGTTTAVASVVMRAPRRMQVVLGVALAASMWLSTAVSLAGGTASSAGPDDDTLVFGLTATQLVVAAAVGAGAGAAVAVASGNAIAGVSLGFGTLGAIYVAHLAAEALVVGGIYYWWPWEPEDESPALRATAIRGAGKDRDAISLPPLRLSPGS